MTKTRLGLRTSLQIGVRGVEVPSCRKSMYAHVIWYFSRPYYIYISSSGHVHHTNVYTPSSDRSPHQSVDRQLHRSLVAKGVDGSLEVAGNLGIDIIRNCVEGRVELLEKLGAELCGERLLLFQVIFDQEIEGEEAQEA